MGVCLHVCMFMCAVLTEKKVSDSLEPVIGGCEPPHDH